MPKRTDIRTILLIGSGPIVIGQGCEFDYSGAQACKTLRAEGYRIVLVNSNPATIMTDPAFADRTYVEPITPEAVRKIIEKEKALGIPIDAVLPTLGGQTALNCACELFDNGTLTEFGIEMIGANREVIHRAEDREAFAKVCVKAGLKTPPARTVNTLEQAEAALEELGLPAIIRPAFTLGGWGGGIAYNREEFAELVKRGLGASMIKQVQIDKSLIGWKEYELEVVRDRRDNCIVVCGIENIDAMGVHTGDSITVAPCLTLTDKEYQALRDAALAIMRGVGVETGGSNVQFAVNPDPEDGKFEFVVIEMNPRVSRSSALASKATGFPIAKIAAKLAVGYTLDELRNDITGTTSACFEPAIDYVVTKIPRWTFEKFPEADETLTTQMKSVGEVMAIGRTFKESFQKAIRSLDVKRFGYGLDRNDKWLTAMRAVEEQQLVLDFSPGARPGTGSVSETGLRTADGQPIEWPIPIDKLTRKLTVPSQGRIYFIRYALKMGWSVERVSELTRIDPFFIDQMAQLVEFEDTLCSYATLEELPREVLFRAKQLGYSDAQLANLYLRQIKSETILEVREHRKTLGIEPVFKLVDTCAAEFAAVTPYYYSTYETGVGRVGDAARDEETERRRDEVGAHSVSSSLDLSVSAPDDEIKITDKQKVIILGGGPNRIGQGIEFDYCCVHAAFAARELGFESVMINNNPETVSTDYDTSDLLFFEPLTLEDVLNVVEKLGGSRHEATKARSHEGAAHSAPVAGPSSLRRSVAPSPGLVRGLIVQFGGQTPLNLAKGLVLAGAPILGTSVDSIDLAEDRDRFDTLLEELGLKRPASGIARSLVQAVEIAGRIGYPVLVRPSYVLGGRGMEICADEAALKHYVTNALDLSGLDDAPILVDKFLDAATEVDVDVAADFTPTDGVPVHSGSGSARALICGVMEHIEHAGVHSGDSSCSVPPWSLPAKLVEQIRETARRMAGALRVCGLMNMQLAIKDGEIYVIEVNPRASRTVPYVGKAKHVPWASVAAKAMMGVSLDEQGARELPDTGAFAVKAPVFPFQKFPGVDFVLGPEMRSTGEVMGIDISMPVAYLKAMLAAGVKPPREGGVFLSVRAEERGEIAEIARPLFAMGYKVYTTEGTGTELRRHGMKPTILQKIAVGARPHVLDLMSDGQIAMVINTPTRTGWQTDEGKIRATAVRMSIPMVTTMTAARAMIRSMEALRAGDWDVAALQDYAEMARARVPEIKLPGARVRV
ncbi:MAG: carbamoyl-phosphate synthase large subunit [Phycisphaerales bacterium]|nr:carbamoyl-phosphate synthase large subunit [Phycisphaerales bacterium]